MFNKKLHEIIEDRDETIQELHRKVAQYQSWYQDALGKLEELRYKINLETKGKYIIVPEPGRGHLFFVVMKLADHGEYSHMVTFDTIEKAEEAMKALLKGPTYYGAKNG